MNSESCILREDYIEVPGGHAAKVWQAPDGDRPVLAVVLVAGVRTAKWYSVTEWECMSAASERRKR